MLARLTLLFITIPLIELFLLVWVGERVGLPATILLVIATGALGAYLARRQGLATWRRFQQESAAGRPPGQTLLDGLMILVAGAVLLTPGLLTDLAGFSLLVPAVRRGVAGKLEGWLRKRVRIHTPPRRPSGRPSSTPFGTAGPAVSGSGPVIEVEADVVRDASTGEEPAR